VQVVSPTAPKRGARDRFSRQQGRNGEYAQAPSERASIIATLRTGSREAGRQGTAQKCNPRAGKNTVGTVEHTRSLISAASGLFQPGHPAVTDQSLRDEHGALWGL